MNKISEELIAPCWMCEKRWRRKETDRYYYFGGMVICSHHNGAKEWYEGALKLAVEKMEMEKNGTSS